MPPLLKGHLDGEKLPVADFIVDLHRVEFVGKEGTWVESTLVTLLL